MFQKARQQVIGLSASLQPLVLVCSIKALDIVSRSSLCICFKRGVDRTRRSRMGEVLMTVSAYQASMSSILSLRCPCLVVGHYPQKQVPANMSVRLSAPVYALKHAGLEETCSTFQHYHGAQGFSASVNAIIENLPRQRQTMLFSATQTKSVKDLARLSLKDPTYISVHAEAIAPTPVKLQQVQCCSLPSSSSMTHAEQESSHSNAVPDFMTRLSVVCGER